MKIKRVFFILLFFTILAAIALVLTSGKPSNTNATGDEPASITPAPDSTGSGAPTSIPEPTGPDPTEVPALQTVAVNLPSIGMEPIDINPDILPVYNGDNALPDYAKKKIFGDVTLNFWHFLGHDVVTSPVENPGILFGSAADYTDVEGITTFRGNHYRDNASFGTCSLLEKKLELVWTKDIGSISYANTYWPGVGWTGQPLIIHWEEDVRNLMNIDPSQKNTDLVEVIYPTLDGNIYFLNLMDGKPTRDPIHIGYSTKGTGMIDPRGYPILYTGQGLNQNGTNAAYHEYRIFSLIDQKEIYSINGTTPEAFRVWGAFDPSALLDRHTDTLIMPGENGLLYRIKMNTQFNRSNGELSISPEVTKYRYEPPFDPNIGYENSPVFFRNYLYLVDNGGLLQCIDINTLEPVWIYNVQDDTDSTIVLEETDEGVFIYTGNEVDLRCLDLPKPAYADCQLRKLNALTGELIWEKSYRCIYQSGVNGGLLSTPVLGKNDISNMVIFNVSKTGDTQSGKMVALDKTTGEEIWVKDLTYYSWSSPVDFLAEDGKTYMVFCDFKGDMHLMDPKNGKILDTISVGANVEGSPAIYNDMVVVGTYAKKIYGVRLK
ncbi:MAG: PQQ-like beta-propeller repeat protein [Clostridiaceae bacterium]|jgi:outer membrane protein assembly factor BamB|nr:PQQ-like beta-propeller repeat protein [Clostridiaceae bacterium]